MTIENLPDQLIKLIETKFENVKASIDLPEDPIGESWIDITAGNFSTSISYRRGVGFGLYIMDSVYGERPDELYRTVEKAAQRITQMYESIHKNGEVLPLGLSGIRELAGQTQENLAYALSVKQPSVSRTEKRSDVKLSSLEDYISALGGRIETKVIFDDMEANLVLPLRRAKLAAVG